MVTQARSQSINGPWENAPNNPLIHTWSKDERWWSKGHGSIVDTPDGKWVIVYHSYEKDFTCLGRQTLMEPIYLGQDGWFHRYDQVDVALPIGVPIKNVVNVDRHTRLSEFRLGLEWKFYKAFDPNRVKVNKGELILKAQGNSPGTSAPLMFVAGIHRYQIEAEIEWSCTIIASSTKVQDSIVRRDIAIARGDRRVGASILPIPTTCGSDWLIATTSSQAGTAWMGRSGNVRRGAWIVLDTTITRSTNSKVCYLAFSPQEMVMPPSRISNSQNFECIFQHLFHHLRVILHFQ